MKRVKTDLSGENLPIFVGQSCVPYQTAVSRLMASADPMISEVEAMNAIDLAELRGEVVIDRVLALVHSRGGSDE